MSARGEDFTRALLCSCEAYHSHDVALLFAETMVVLLLLLRLLTSSSNNVTNFELLED